MANSPKAMADNVVQPRRILLVDDNDGRRATLRAELAAAGLTVYEAAEGLAALDLLKRQPIDALICEVLAPGKYGYRLCCALRHNAQYRPLPLLLHTDPAHTGINEAMALDMGADRYVPRPATTPQLLEALYQAAEDAARRAAAPLTPQQEIALLQNYSSRLVDQLEERTAQLVERTVQLHEREPLFHQMADSVADVFWMMRNDVLLYVNPTVFQRMFGRPVDAVYSGQSTWMEWIHPDDRAETARRFDGLMQTGHVSNTFRIMRPDGEIRWLHGRGHFVATEPDGSVLTAGIVRDITEEKHLSDVQAEQAHRQTLIVAYGQYALNATQVEDVYAEGVRLLCDTLRAHLVIIYAADAESASLRCIATSDGDTIKSELEISSAHHPGATYLADETLVGDFRFDTRFGTRAVPDVTDAIAAIGIPLQDAEQKFGALCVYADRPLAFGDACLQFTRNIANIVAATMARSRAEAALRSSEERLRLAVAGGQLGLWHWDLQTGNLELSPELRTMFGLPANAPLDYDSVLAHMHPDDRARFRRANEVSLKTGQPFAEDFRIVLPDGSVRWMTGRGAPVFDEAGKPLRMEGVTLDSTAQRKVDEQLRRSEERLRLAIAAGRLDVWRWNLCTDDLEASAGIYELLGLPIGSPITNSDYMSAVHAADLPRVERTLERHLQHGEPYEAQYRVLRPDGDVRWVESRGAVARDSEGNPLHVEGVIMDITRQKEIERELRQSEQRLRFAVQAGHMGTWNVDLATDHVRASPECATILGAPELSTMAHFEQSLHPEDRERVVSLVRRMFEIGGHYEIEYRVMHSDAGVHWIANYGTVHKNEHGEATRAEGLVQDITERKRTEEQIYSLTQELERRVEERTQQLQTAMQQLESFSYSISHDLRAPLRAINGFASILKEELGDSASATVDRCIATITRNSERMSELIDGLLSFARLDRAALQHETIDMRALAQEVVRDLEQLEPDRPIETRIEPLPAACGDPILVRQALFNLLSNAFKFTRNRTPARIVIGHEGGSDDAYYVRDNGVGFDMSYADRLFGIFQRLHSGGEFEGTGVGLALTRRIIERHGGRIWAHSEPGEGTAFRFTLPSGGDGSGSPDHHGHCGMAD